MKAASVEATTTSENAPGRFIIRREGNARNRPSDRVPEKMKIVRFFGGQLCGTKS